MYTFAISLPLQQPPIQENAAPWLKTGFAKVELLRIAAF